MVDGNNQGATIEKNQAGNQGGESPHGLSPFFVSQIPFLFHKTCYRFSMQTSSSDRLTEITTVVAGNIRMALALKRLSMRDVATAAGISVATLSRITSGQKDIGLEQLKLIADATGTNFRSLLDGAI